MRAPQGWMEVPSLAWLKEAASHARAVAEVGCWRGLSTRALVSGLPPGGRLWAVDTWADPAYADPERAYEDFLRNMKRPIAAGTVTVMRMDSCAAAARLWQDGIRFDLVFIDANHSLESVRNDLAAWEPLVETGGVLAGHDWWTEPGVTQAVSERYPGRIQRGADSIWWVQR